MPETIEQIIERCTTEDGGLRICQCQMCGTGTIIKHDNWYQCDNPNCRAVSTQFGGFYDLRHPNDK